MHTFDKGSYESVQSVWYHPGPSSFFLIHALRCTLVQEEKEEILKKPSCGCNRFVRGSPEFSSALFSAHFVNWTLSPTTTLAWKCLSAVRDVTVLATDLHFIYLWLRQNSTPVNHSSPETNRSKCTWFLLCMHDHTGGNVTGGFTSAVLQ